MTAIEDVTGRKALYSRIEGVGEVNTKEFIEHGLRIGYD